VALVVVNSNGCIDTSEYLIYIEGEPEYVLPNVFTPNGDGTNDRFYAETSFVEDASLKVFNRWGRPVFSYDGTIKNLNDTWGWDGSINGGAKAASGTYYYILDLKGVNGENFSEQGTVTLLR
jgi:gliding motility-associated-like protein